MDEKVKIETWELIIERKVVYFIGLRIIETDELTETHSFATKSGRKAVEKIWRKRLPNVPTL